MNRRGFFGLLAAMALLPKRAVGQLKYTSYTFTPWRKLKVIHADIYGKTRRMESRWEDDVFATSLPVRFRDAIGSRVRTTICLSKGRYRHICRWTESTA